MDKHTLLRVLIAQGLGRVAMPEQRTEAEAEALRSIGARPARHGGKEGIEVDGMFIEASDTRPDAIVASGAEDDLVEGTVADQCSDCGRVVYLAPSSQRVRQRYGDVPVLCIPCVLRREGWQQV